MWRRLFLWIIPCSSTTLDANISDEDMTEMDTTLAKVKKAWGRQPWIDFQRWTIDESFRFRARHEEREQEIRAYLEQHSLWGPQYVEEELNERMVPITAELDAEYKDAVRKEFEERLRWSSFYTADWARATETERAMIIERFLAQPLDDDTIAYRHQAGQRFQNSPTPHAPGPDPNVQPHGK